MAALTLEVVEGPDAGTVFTLAGTLEIGRDATADIRLDDEHADPHHALIEIDAEGVLLTDLPPRGGTFVNHVELLTSTRIEPGDEVQVGITVLTLRAAGASSAARPAPPALAVPPREPGYLAALAGRRRTPESAARNVDSLLDARTKTKARHAPLAVFVIVVYAVLLYLWTARF